jgi:HPt (histidine-containing phosphotransfer) domain-containing protein
VESGSRQENASKQESGVDQRFHEMLKDFIAFSSEVESGSRQENASKQESGVDQRFHEMLKDSSLACGLEKQWNEST